MRAALLDTDVFSFVFKRDTRAALYALDLAGAQPCLWKAMGRQKGMSPIGLLDLSPFPSLFPPRGARNELALSNVQPGSLQPPAQAMRIL